MTPAQISAFMDQLAAAIAAVCPFDPDSLAIGDPGDRTTWRYTPTTAATADQVRAAQTAVAGFVYAAPRPQVSAKQVTYALNHLGFRAQWDVAYPTQKQDDRDWFVLGDDPFPITHKRILRMMALAGVDAGKVMAQAQVE